MWMAAIPPNELTAGFKTVHDRAALFVKRNAEASSAVASELTNAKTIDDLGAACYVGAFLRALTNTLSVRSSSK